MAWIRMPSLDAACMFVWAIILSLKRDTNPPAKPEASPQSDYCRPIVKHGNIFSDSVDITQIKKITHGRPASPQVASAKFCLTTFKASGGYDPQRIPQVNQLDLRF
ncbi:uncharacterized protein PADG_11330 [Paracoccidioides brasiliensis Pb18]|uniref:Uncharacterized protein n=1 Tax=Paracoccidioides brasiliensis (strain Pb18) TaxID=502780 RepID=A0A0A0HV74_PARBD|nr:uncharacterized protein PADG_11330 [Paracoccidioides brasiliensis Pb18]KGM92507.1 hypothetical protein PADG_11330 [Paracoccidioides brasiliensis Pb18]